MRILLSSPFKPYPCFKNGRDNLHLNYANTTYGQDIFSIPTRMHSYGLHLIAQNTDDFAFIGYNFGRVGVVTKHNTLFHGLINLSRDRGHLHPGAAVDHAHIGSQAFGHPGAVHGRIAAADDDYILADIHPFAAVDFM